MASLNARLSRAEQAAQAKHDNNPLVVFLEDGIYDLGGGKTFATLEDVHAEALRLGVDVDNITVVQFVDADIYGE